MSHMPEDLRAFIVGTTAVTRYISTRCHYNDVPQISAKSFAWFRVAADSEELTMDGVGGLHEAMVDIEAVGATETAAQDAGDAIKVRLHGYKGTPGSITCQGAWISDKDDSYFPYANRSDEGAHVVAYSLRMFYTT